MTVGDLWQRSVLRRAALRYAERGWPVMPGAFLIDDRYVCGPLCPTVACHPAVSQWERSASVDPSDVERWWADAPYSVLLATGHTFDVIEVPARIGVPAVAAARIGPVAVAPTGRWMFLVAPGDVAATRARRPARRRPARHRLVDPGSADPDPGRADPLAGRPSGDRLAAARLVRGPAPAPGPPRCSGCRPEHVHHDVRPDGLGGVTSVTLRDPL